MIEAEAAPKVRRGTRSDEYFKHLTNNCRLAALLQYLLPDRTLTGDLAAVVNHDDRAGLVCAITALCAAAGEFIAVGDMQDGWIILPPEGFVQPSFLEAFIANAKEETGETLRFARRYPSGCR
jgi:hypothetical protein